MRASNTVWSPARVDLLKQGSEDDMSSAELSVIIGVAAPAIEWKARKMGLTLRLTKILREWTGAEVELLRTMTAIEIPVAQIAMKLQRSKAAILKKIYSLALLATEDQATDEVSEADHDGHVQRILSVQPWGFITPNSFKPGGCRFGWKEAA